jgi:hypothetical protein
MVNAPAIEPCAVCGKPPTVCICDRVEAVPCRLKVVVLQHPQEREELLGSARLLTLTLAGSELRVGLSWPSLAAALGVQEPDRERWAVLAAAKLPKGAPEPDPKSPVVLMERNGKPRPLTRARLDGLLVLDGTWTQAKALWWRNPWLIKLPRLALHPREPSLYGKLRRPPRREWVSTLEAVADVLPALGEPEATRTNLRRLFRTLLQRARDHAIISP